MNKLTCKQCVLEKGNRRDTVWIPAKLAKVGKSIVVKATGETWKVGIVYENEMPEEYLVEHSRDYKHQRQASDI
jgi:hypothetical protein